MKLDIEITERPYFNLTEIQMFEGEFGIGKFELYWGSSHEQYKSATDIANKIKTTLLGR